MDQNNDFLDHNQITHILLQRLKSEGTFDEFRRYCMSDIETKAMYQNWTQRIEVHVREYLSRFKYTPDLNKNAVREQLRKHMSDGLDSHGIEKAADMILEQIIVPRMFTAIRSKISDAVDEYLGIENEAPSTEQNVIQE